MKRTCLIAFCLLGLASAQQGNQGNQNNNDDQQARLEALEKKLEDMESEGHKRFWQGNLNGSEIMIAVDRIGSISKTQYLLDGGLIVHEVVIDALGGQALTRIYHVAPVTDAMAQNTASKIVDRVREVTDKAANRAGTRIHEMVEKNYPTTTHAHTVEFRVMDVQDLDALYASVKSSWITGKGRVFTIK